MLTYSSLSDFELTDLLRKDDASAFTVIYNRYFDVLYVHAYKRLQDKDEAQDVIHELFAHIWNKRRDFFIKTNLSAYLATAVRNKILDVISHQEVESKYVSSLQGFLDEGHCITDHRVRERQLVELIDKGIADLPPKMREVFELSRRHQMSHKQIAEQLNLSEQTVRKQVNNALKILRVKLGLMLFISL
ncbi:RNA polymerase sigma-70 factor [Pedobacter frigoris]|uniref:RNA polymerase sigma-70 factor n=1 Tax=Pedobacter frigoris TaxID=2571272 RepID=UPI00292D6C1A|nr:RNA polymerase sigma-70 factor [Pedobacter frigoris]